MYIISIMRFLLFLASATAATASYVPGKAFDRFITIWLENQVCDSSLLLANGNGTNNKNRISPR
jgi:hypothetical protein